MNEELLTYQQRILPGVSRTFALTIPQLPPGLREVVANAYLLCRIADTIEDDPELAAEDKAACLAAYVDAVRGRGDAAAFARAVAPRLSASCPAQERDLVAHAPEVLAITAGFRPAQRKAIDRCVAVMCEGMAEFQARKNLRGLGTLEDMDRYCYFAAGVVGEMLTELFCDHCPELMPRRQALLPLAVCFGQGLQMTNILKDVWEDREAGNCWLPRAFFEDLPGALARADHAALAPGIDRLVAVAHGHLRSALRYTLMIPRSEAGIRRFCLWALGMAVLTLRRIHANPGFANGQQVKISRRAVRATVIATSLAARSNGLLQLMFDLAARDLPETDTLAACPPAGAPVAPGQLG
ncbi:MAG: phytoene/squalene synthase family protein [Gammaproteobacteria bacterium]|nr:MAG: phytoene/squalene synthase family protein [Gammaproteobacteria bacterium]